VSLIAIFLIHRGAAPAEELRDNSKASTALLGSPTQLSASAIQ
jgi:hypothetical protein